jgi:DNA polymerase-4
MERTILHVDVNNAFLSWTAIERLNNGEKIDIREIPAVIGGDEERRSGIVLAKSQMAKSFGIVTGETLYMARQKCPNLQVFKGDYAKYKIYSNKLFDLLSEYTDQIERFSIDECFLDLTHYLMGRDVLEIAKEINYRVKNELKFTVNIGISTNKLLAKMASDFEKPDKIHTLYKNEIPEKMWVLPVNDLLFLGKKTVPKLFNMRIKTIGDLAHFNKEILIRKFGKAGNQMWEYANRNRLSKSESHSRKA